MIYDPRSIQLTPEQQEKVAAFAERTGLPWERVLENMMRQISLRSATPLPNGESVGAIARRLGVSGCMGSGLGDLSTNPAHMEGFGESHAD
jgi:hypothetical protein